MPVISLIEGKKEKGGIFRDDCVYIIFEESFVRNLTLNNNAAKLLKVLKLQT